MELTCDNYEDIITHYSLSEKRYNSLEENRFYLFGIILFTENDIQLIHDLFRNIYELHFSTGSRILVISFIPQKYYAGRTRRKRNIKPDEITTFIAPALTKQSYSFLES